MSYLFPCLPPPPSLLDSRGSAILIKIIKKKTYLACSLLNSQHDISAQAEFIHSVNELLIAKHFGNQQQVPIFCKLQHCYCFVTNRVFHAKILFRSVCALDWAGAAI